MAKTLKDFLNERQLGPMVVKNPDEQKFIDKHVIAKVADRNGNDDELFKGSKVKMADRPSHRKGYNPGEDEKVYEETLGESTYEFDISGEHGNAAVDKLVRHANSKGIKAKVHTYNGPGGGNPVIHLSHKDPKAVHSYVKKHIDPDVDLSHHKINEELKGNQHKIDANKNGKVDAHDFKLLRSKKKKVAEEAEQIDELSTSTLQSYRKKARAQGNAIVDKMKMGGGDWSKDQKDTKTLRKRAAGAQASGKQLVKRGESLKTEEAEQIDELDRQLGGTLSRYINKTKDNPKREAGRNLALKKRWGDAKHGTPEPKVKGVDRFKEEAEPIEELSKATLRSYAQNAKDQMSRSDTVAGREMGARAIGAKPSARERMHNRRADKRHAGLGLAIDKLAREEVEIEEKLDMKKASMGTVVKDFQKSDAPQFKGKSQKKRQVMAIAAKLSAERGGKPLNKEERLLANLGDLAETHKRTLLNVFAKLNEDNQRKFMAACETPEGVEQMLDFAIQNRGE